MQEEGTEKLQAGTKEWMCRNLTYWGNVKNPQELDFRKIYHRRVCWDLAMWSFEWCAEVFEHHQWSAESGTALTAGMAGGNKFRRAGKEQMCWTLLRRV